MISNKHRYTILRATQFLLAPFFTIISVFLKKNNNIILTSSLNKEFSDNSKALFEMLVRLDEFADRVYFVLNNAALAEKLNKKYSGRFISNTGLTNCIFILRARYWFCASLEMPAPSFFQRFIRQVYHLGHGMPVKRFGLLENQVSWYKKIYYWFVTSNIGKSVITTDFFAKYISAGYALNQSKLIKIPQPKTAQIASPSTVTSSILTNDKLTHVLYAPTWRPYAAVEVFPFTDLGLESFSSFLTENEIHIWLRVHPRFEQELDASLLDCPNIHLFSAKEYSEVNSYLVYFDALITDYSSIYYDFLTLKRPVLFFDYDFEKYNEIVGVIDEYQRVKPIETTKSAEQFKQQLLTIKSRNFDLTTIKEVNRLVNYPVENEGIAEVVLEKLRLY